MKYKYDGRGERVVREEDFASLGVEHPAVYFNEDNDYTQELSDEAAEKLQQSGERLTVVSEESEGEDDTVEETPEAVEEPNTKATSRKGKAASSD